jgi:Xaa-Pro aminopeptidase
LPGLSREVRSYRLGRMRGLMRDHHCDALAFTGADWFEWAGNHAISALSWERPFLLVVTSDGRTFALLPELSRNAIEAERRRGTLWIDTVAFYAESRDATQHKWIATQLREMVVHALGSFGLSRARIGADAVHDWLRSAADALAAITLIKLGNPLRSLRWIKHPEEIATMRRCASLSDWAVDVYRRELKSGRLLAEVDFLVSASLAAEAARRHPGENFVIGRLVTHSGPASACPHGDGASNGKVLERDAIAVTTLATRLNGLAMELARPWLVGSPGAELVRLLDCVRAAQEAAIDASVAGRAIAGMHQAAQDVLNREGLGAHLRLRAGHAIGVVMHDFPENVPFDDRPFLEHETYVVEPAIYPPDIGAFRFADAIAIRNAEPELLTRAPKDRAAQSLH